MASPMPKRATVVVALGVLLSTGVGVQLITGSDEDLPAWSPDPLHMGDRFQFRVTETKNGGTIATALELAVGPMAEVRDGYGHNRQVLIVNYSFLASGHKLWSTETIDPLTGRIVSHIHRCPPNDGCGTAYVNFDVSGTAGLLGATALMSGPAVALPATVGVEAAEDRSWSSFAYDLAYSEAEKNCVTAAPNDHEVVQYEFYGTVSGTTFLGASYEWCPGSPMPYTITTPNFRLEQVTWTPGSGPEVHFGNASTHRSTTSLGVNWGVWNSRIPPEGEGHRLLKGALGHAANESREFREFLDANPTASILWGWIRNGDSVSGPGGTYSQERQELEMVLAAGAISFKIELAHDSAKLVGGGDIPGGGWTLLDAQSGIGRIGSTIPRETPMVTIASAHDVASLFLPDHWAGTSVKRHRDGYIYEFHHIESARAGPPSIQFTRSVTLEATRGEVLQIHGPVDRLAAYLPNAD